MDKIVDYLCDYTRSLSFEELPIETVRQTKRLLVDTLACAIGGYASGPSKIARLLADTVSSRQPATVLGSGQQTSLELATFANGVMIRYLDFNDGYTSRESGHPSDAIAAVLSPAEIARADGKSVITATVLAYEVFCRLCDAVSVRSRGFDHVTVGVIASTAAAAKALGLTPEHTAQAFNLSIAANNALYQTRIGDVSLWKGCAFANASRNAVFAVQLAAQGLTFSPDERRMYVADYSRGVVAVDMAARTAAPLETADSVLALGIDGLYYHKGALIGIQNGVEPHRVVRLELSGDGTRIIRSVPVERAHPQYIEPTLGAPDDPKLAPASLDRILVVDTWHHVPARGAYAAKLRAALKPGGAIYIVDYTLEASKGPPRDHRLAPMVVVAELTQGGMRATVLEEDLPEQYIVKAEL